jgi:hypothetical protein
MLIALFLLITTMARDGKAAIVLGAVLGASLILLLIFEARKTPPLPTEGALTGSSDDAETQPDVVAHTYEMRTSARWYERVSVLGIIMGAGVSLAFAAWLLYGVIEFKAPTVRHIVDLLSLIAIADLFGGFAAIFTIAESRSRATIVRANADGLIQDGPIYWTLIPWNSVVSLERNEDATPFYEDEGDVGYTVKWAVQAPKSLMITPSAGASLVTPEQLVEIVMAHSGVPITTRVHGERPQRAGSEIRYLLLCGELFLQIGKLVRVQQRIDLPNACGA